MAIDLIVEFIFLRHRNRQHAKGLLRREKEDEIKEQGRYPYVSTVPFGNNGEKAMLNGLK